MSQHVLQTVQYISLAVIYMYDAVFSIKIGRGEPSKTPQVPKTPHARFSEVPDPTHFFNLPGKQKSFGENTVKVWWVLLSLCLFYAVKCVSYHFLMLITLKIFGIIHYWLLGFVLLW